MRVLLVGGGAREHAIADAVCRAGRANLFSMASNRNPGLLRLSSDFEQCDERDVGHIAEWAKGRSIDLAVIGHERALDAGVVDKLNAVGIAAVGPTIAAAQLEMSKIFLRRLMDRFEIPGQVLYYHFDDPDAVSEFLRKQSGDFVLKPIGLTGGKGVKIMGEQLESVDDAIAYAREVLSGSSSGEIILEERLAGEEFTLQAFTDGIHLSPMPLVQDFKRAFEGDQGPNTGSMGSYSQANGLLPFVSAETYDRCLDILQRVIAGARTEGARFRGIIYGQFMLTSDGVKLVEINARFGDPEAANVLPLLKTDFLDICGAIVEDRLATLRVEFESKATVCKYVAPHGYPTAPETGVAIQLNEPRIRDLGVKVYFARLDESHGQYLTTTSRALALVGVANTVREAESSVESALAEVKGRYHVRHDIGRPELIARFE